MMKKYRRRPIEVEAVQWNVIHTPSDDAKPIVDFINQNGGKAFFVYDWLESEGTHFPHIMIETLEGKFAAKPGDFICRGVSGEFWPVKPHIFHATNEEIVILKGDVTITTDALITLKEHD